MPCTQTNSVDYFIDMCNIRDTAWSRKYTQDNKYARPLGWGNAINAKYSIYCPYDGNLSKYYSCMKLNRQPNNDIA